MIMEVRMIKVLKITVMKLTLTTVAKDLIVNSNRAGSK